MSPTERLTRDAALVGVTLTPPQAVSLLTLLDELERWNKTYNLTAIGSREEMITHHLLDSLSIHTDLCGTRIADVGTGAGFPGLPLAIVNPSRHFTLIDSSGKKVRFVAHAARTLSLANVTGVQARAEDMRPEAPFDTVTARALAPLPRLLAQVAPLCGPETRVLAMKGHRSEEELARIRPPWRLVGVRSVAVPGLAAARCVVTLSMGG